MASALSEIYSGRELVFIHLHERRKIRIALAINLIQCLSNMNDQQKEVISEIMSNF